MKKRSFTTVLLGGFLFFVNCEKEDSAGGSSDPNVFCNEAGCAVSDANKQRFFKISRPHFSLVHHQSFFAYSEYLFLL